MLSIAHISEWWKRNESDYLLVGAVMSVAMLAFLIGRISIVSSNKLPLVIEVPDIVLQKQSELQRTSMLMNEAISDPKKIVSEGIPEAERKGEYVASKNGRYYYAADMAAAARLSPKNRLWFSNPKDAEERGYAPAKNLP